MPNVLDNAVVLEAAQGLIVFRDLSIDTDVLYIHWYPGNPSGTLVAPIGSIVSGLSGAYINTDGASSWSSLAGGGGGQALSFIFREGEPAPSGNLYADWDLLYADFNAPAIQGQARTIIIDDSLTLGVGCTITTGAFDFTQTTLRGASESGGRTSLVFSSGATLTSPPNEITQLRVVTNNTVPLWSGNDRVIYLNSVQLSGPDIAVPPEGGMLCQPVNGFMTVVIDGQDNAGTSVWNGALGAPLAGWLILYMYGNAELGFDALQGAGSVSIYNACEVERVDFNQAHAEWSGGLTAQPIGGIEPCTPPDEAYIDRFGVVDSTLRRAFTTIANAYAAGFTKFLLGPGNHTMAINTMLTAGWTSRIHIRSTDRGSQRLAISGESPAAGVLAGVGIYLDNIEIVNTSACTVVGATLSLQDCAVRASAGLRSISATTLRAQNTTFSQIYFGVAAAQTDIALTDCHCTYSAGSGSQTLFAYCGRIQLFGGTINFYHGDGALVVNPATSFEVLGTSIRYEKDAFAATIIDAPTITLQGVTLTCASAGGGLTFATSAASAPVGLFVSGTAIPTGLPTGAWYTNGANVSVA